MESTLDLWNQVVDSIASRMPGSPETETDEVLVPLSVLDRYPSIPTFAREFLSRAKKPPFKMIAPELQVQMKSSSTVWASSLVSTTQQQQIHCNCYIQQQIFCSSLGKHLVSHSVLVTTKIDGHATGDYCTTVQGCTSPLMGS